MKTPEEIKKGLECRNSMICYTNGCPYYTLEDDVENGRPVSCLTKSGRDALAYIQQLERERDAAVADLNCNWKCAICKRFTNPINKCIHYHQCGLSYMFWEWRGVPEKEENNG